MQNSDALILLSRKIAFDQGLPSPHEQALRIAVYDEYGVFEKYKAIIESYGPNPPFTNILQCEIRHYEALLKLCEKYEVEPPINDINVTAPKTLQECYELAIASEIENISMYDNLLPYVKDYPDIEDTFYKLQAASYNNHLPTFRMHLQKYLQTPNSINQDDFMSKINDFSQMAQKIATGQADPNELTQMMSSFNTSLLAGILAGGIGGFAINEMFKNQEEEE